MSLPLPSDGATAEMAGGEKRRRLHHRRWRPRRRDITGVPRNGIPKNIEAGQLVCNVQDSICSRESLSEVGRHGLADKELSGFVFAEPASATPAAVVTGG